MEKRMWSLLRSVKDLQASRINYHVWSCWKSVMQWVLLHLMLPVTDGYSTEILSWCNQLHTSPVGLLWESEHFPWQIWNETGRISEEVLRKKYLVFSIKNKAKRSLTTLMTCGNQIEAWWIILGKIIWQKIVKTHSHTYEPYEPLTLEMCLYTYQHPSPCGHLTIQDLWDNFQDFRNSLLRCQPQIDKMTFSAKAVLIVHLAFWFAYSFVQCLFV